VPGGPLVSDGAAHARRFEMNRDRVHMASRVADIELCRAIAPELQSFEQWVARNEGNLRAMLGHKAA
jgi:hypothetical protein